MAWLKRYRACLASMGPKFKPQFLKKRKKITKNSETKRKTKC
jgi:hypothetical protein